MYANVPSITGYPVCLGNFDALLAPYVGEADDDALYRVVRNLWVCWTARCPTRSRTPTSALRTPRRARVLRAAAELNQVVPNLSCRSTPTCTPDDLVLDAVRPSSPAAARTSSTTR